MFAETERARRLAQTMVDTAAGLGCQTAALLTDMSQPLGRWVGNAAEVGEALACLEGAGPEPLMEVVLALCEEASALAGRPLTRAELGEAISSGAARERFERWVAAQGGDAAALSESSRLLAPCEVVVEARSAGYLSAVDCRAVGFLMVEAGAGRSRPGQAIDPAVSLRYDRRLGDRLEPGDEIARAYLRAESRAWAQRLEACFEIGPERVTPPAMIGGRVEAGASSAR